MAKKKALDTSETRVIKRSLIRMNPSNVKRHTDDRIKLQEKNLKKVGYLGGVVWNETTGNLIDGHRRVKAMDLYYGYDGTPDTDYDVKVEVAHLDPKGEKQQLVYMGAGDTKADIDLIAGIADDINLDEIGFGQGEIDDILSFGVKKEEKTQTLLDELIERRPVPERGTPEYEEKKAMVKDGKARNMDNSRSYALEDGAEVVLSFTRYEDKVAFCELVGADPNGKYIKGEEVLGLFE